MDNEKKLKLENILVNVGDLCFKRRLIEIIDSLDLKDNDKILDCGCGEGFYTMVVNNLFPKIKSMALDYDLSILNKAKKWIGSKKNIEFIQGDICKLPFKDNSFDKIILSEVLEHIPDDLKALTEVKRVIKPNGVIAITVPNHNYPFFWDPLNWVREHLGLGHFNPNNGLFGGIWAMHLRLYHPDEIRDLVERIGLKIEKIKVLTHYCVPFNHNILYIGKQFYIKMPVSDSLKKSMEKFEWEQNNRSSNRFSLLKFIFKIFKKIDEKNNNDISLDKTSMSIFLVCVK